MREELRAASENASGHSRKEDVVERMEMFRAAVNNFCDKLSDRSTGAHADQMQTFHQF